MSSAALAARRAVASPSTQCSASTQTLKHRVIATRRARDSRRASSASASASESAQLLRGRAVANKLADTSLFLIGIMGSGKSTVGASLAKALGYNHLDTDELIKSVTKKTPSELFAEAVATVGLLVTIFGSIAVKAEPTIPMAVGLYITAGYWFTSSTSFANPAITIARAMTDTFAGIRPVDVPGFILGQIGGALAAFAAGALLLPKGDKV